MSSAESPAASRLRLKDPVSGLSHLAGFLVSLLAGGVLIGATRGAGGCSPTCSRSWSRLAA